IEVTGRRRLSPQRSEGSSERLVTSDSENIIVSGNTVDQSGDNGIYIVSNPRAESSVTLVGNTVDNSGGDGIEVRNALDIDIIGNTVSNSFENGVYVAGGNTGSVVFQGNTLIDNGHLSGSAGARFESGAIDMSDLDNPNTIINTTGLPAVGLQFDEAEEGRGISIVGNTLGSTIFDGFTPEGSFYVRIEDGTLLDDGGEPVVIDGTDASFDDIIPGTFPGEVLPVATLEFIEERLFDADDEDIDGRGQIFVGDPPEEDDGGPTNFEDFLPERAFSNQTTNSASLTINGLPFINGTGGPLGLNNIAPAAGEGEGEQFANINPEAGEGQPGSEVTCVEDALSSIGSGPVTYNFGGSFEDSIAAASACSTAGL
ncbi:MAG: right-handed parallel beta-helix repeat-containing protein, partial [Alphaproteobacteria bacterium]